STGFRRACDRARVPGEHRSAHAALRRSAHPRSNGEPLANERARRALEEPMIGGKLRVSCFGKLPIFPDFLEPVHRTRARDDLRQWLAAGAGRPSSGADGSGLPRRAYRVVWPVRGGKEIIIALIWSSSDAVGRSFPFALYTQARPRRLGIASAADLPFAAEPVWSRLEEIASTEEGVPWVDLSTGTI